MSTEFKKMGLSISERVFAIRIINEYKGTLELLAFLLEDIKKISITDEDWEKAEKKVDSSVDERGRNTITWTWNDEKAGEKEVELSKDTVTYLVDQIDKRNKNGEFTINDKAVITLKNKLI